MSEQSFKVGRNNDKNLFQTYKKKIESVKSNEQKEYEYILDFGYSRGYALDWEPYNISQAYDPNAPPPPDSLQGRQLAAEKAKAKASNTKTAKAAREQAAREEVAAEGATAEGAAAAAVENPAGQDEPVDQ